MSIATKSLGDAVRTLAGSSSPVLFCDTCAFLDLIRLPFRESQPSTVASYLATADSVLKAVLTGDISLVTPALVFNEWHDNAQNVLSETERHFKKLESHIEIAREVALHAGLTLDGLNLISLQLPKLLYTLSEELLNSSLVLDKETGPSMKANDRAASNIAPASKGAIKDCLIYEHVLWLMTELRRISFNKPIVLLTSNTIDYCNGGKLPKEPIKTELSQLNVVLATNWDWAFHELKLMAATP